MSYKAYCIAVALSVIPLTGVTSTANYCGELDLSPDLSRNNARVYVNPHSLGCNLSTSLPGLGALNIGQAVCERLSEKANNVLDRARNKLDQELASIGDKAQSELDNLTDSDIFRDRGSSSSGGRFTQPDTSSDPDALTPSNVFRNGSYSDGKFHYTTASGMKFSMDMSRGDYIQKKGGQAIVNSILSAENHWKAAQAAQKQTQGPGRVTTTESAPKRSNEVRPTQKSGSGSSSQYNGYFN